MGTWAKYADLGQWNFAVAVIRSTVLEGGRDTRWNQSAWVLVANGQRPVAIRTRTRVLCGFTGVLDCRACLPMFECHAMDKGVIASFAVRSCL